MKNYNEQIVRYLDGQFSKEEEEEFEKSLLFDAELKYAYSEYLRTIELISSTKYPEVKEDYFNDLIPKFRQSLNKSAKISPFRKASYSFITIIIFVFSFLIFNNYRVNTNPENVTIESITQNISDEQINEVSDYLTNHSWVLPSEDIVTQVMNDDYFNIDGIIQNASDEEGYNILSAYQINNIESFAGEEDLQQAYEELLAKSIL